MSSKQRQTSAGISRGGPSLSVQLGGIEQTKPKRFLTKSQAAHLAEEYRAAALRNTAAAIELGGQQGDALRRLARHFAQRALRLGVQAGGLA